MISIRTRVSARPLTEFDFLGWLGQAMPGEPLIYHRGLLALDRSARSQDGARSSHVSPIARWAAATGLRPPSPTPPWDGRLQLPRHRASGAPRTSRFSLTGARHDQQLHPLRHRTPLGVFAQSVGHRAGGVGDGATDGTPQPTVGPDGARQGSRARRACRVCSIRHGRSTNAPAQAVKAFDRDMALVPDDRRDSEREAIPGYVACGLAELRQYGIPTAYQDRVELRLDDVPVPVIGFIDWRFDDHGLIVDLKTSERLPSAISLSHARQGAVYARAHGNYGMRFAYVKPSAGKKDGRAVVVYELERMDIERQLVALRQIALRLERFLALSNDARRTLRPARPRLRALPLDQSGHASARRGNLRLLNRQPERRKCHGSEYRRNRPRKALLQIQRQSRQVVCARRRRSRC